MSETTVMSPVVAALVKSEDFLGKNRIWSAINDPQVRFLDFLLRRHELAKFSPNELRSWASLVADELNKILQQEGFNIRLEDFGENEFGVVSILDVLVEWLEKGAKTQLVFGGKKYPAVKLDDGFEVRMSLKYHMPIAILDTKSGDRVFMTVADCAYVGFDLVARIEEISNIFMGNGGRYDSLIFPMVDLNQRVDIGWLKGMQTQDKEGNEVIVSQALQQTKFKMNEVGARVKSAVATGFIRCALPRQFIIDKPFLLWIRRPGLSFPVMYAYINEADWKDPGSLESI